MDEATASLDAENETAIQEALSRLIRNKTVLIIAHRMRTIANADKIVIAAPFWDMSFPSLLKVYIENIYTIGIVSA